MINHIVLSFSDLSLDVNSDVIIVGIKGMESIYLQEPITIEFEIHEVSNQRTLPQHIRDCSPN